MDRRYYSKRHFERLANGGPDTPEAIAERRANQQAGKLAIADREAKYPTLTAENAGEAMDYQGKRLQFHKKQLLARK